MEKVIIGIDLGGTNLRIGGVTPGNEMLAPSAISSTLIANADQPVQALCGVIQDYIKANRLPMVEAVSIGVPSSVARDKETVICTTNIRNRQGRPVFDHTNIALELRNRLGVPVFVNNDVNNILLYDVAANHLEGQQMVVGIYIGTGVGAAVLAGGRLLEGKDGAELDLGHIPFFEVRPFAAAGKEDAVSAMPPAGGCRRFAYYPDTEIQDLFTCPSGEPPLRRFVEDCAYIYAIMTTIFNPDSLIAGGGVMEMKDFPRSDFERLVNEKTGIDVMSYGFRYIYSESYVGKGVIGAAVFARRRMMELSRTA